MSSINLGNVQSELLYFLRNQDIFTVTERGVTTATDTGIFASDSTHLISVSNGKNIRSITVGGSPLAFGTDYTYDLNFDDSGTIKIKITFTAAQTGAFSIPYDFGTDKIWPDFPRDDLSIDSYPRVAVDIAAMNSDLFGYGNQKVAVSTSILFSVVVYDQSVKTINDLITDIRDKVQTNQNGFFYFNITTPNSVGPLIEDANKRQEIMHRNVDFLSNLNIERAT